TLSISPRTALKVVRVKRIKVYGTRKADGVTFTASGASWGGLYFSGADGSTSKKSRIENATTGIRAQNMSNLVVRGTTISGSSNFGLLAISISGSQIENTE